MHITVFEITWHIPPLKHEVEVHWLLLILLIRIFVKQLVPEYPIAQVQRYWTALFTNKGVQVPPFRHGFNRQGFENSHRNPKKLAEQLQVASDEPLWTQTPWFRHGFGLQTLTFLIL